MSAFRSLTETELDRLTSDELVAYLREASGLGRGDDARRALGVLVFRHSEDVKRRVAIKLRGPETRPDVEDVAMDAIESAIKSAFDGTAVGQFIKWLHTIVDRRIADYYRRREARPKTDPLPEEHSDGEEVWGTSAVVEDETDAAGELADLRAAAESVMPENEVHKRVLDLYIYEDLDAAGTAKRINKLFDELDPPMSADNVHQIAKRFRDKLRKQLEDND